MADYTPEDVIYFKHFGPAGQAQIVLPITIGCPVCHGLIAVQRRNADGGTHTIYDGELACQISLVTQGYNLHANEIIASRGLFRGRNGHDGMPDDWQHITIPQPCSCACQHEWIAGPTRCARCGKTLAQLCEEHRKRMKHAEHDIDRREVA